MAATAVSRSCSPPSQLRQKFTVKDIGFDDGGVTVTVRQTVEYAQKEVGLELDF